MYVIDCAGVVDIKGEYDPLVYSVNATGSANVARLTQKTEGRLVYISSVHAMPPKPQSEKIYPAVTYDPVP